MRLPTALRSSGKNVRYNVALAVGEAEAVALVEVGELLVVDAEELERVATWGDICTFNICVNWKEMKSLFVANFHDPIFLTAEICQKN